MKVVARVDINERDAVRAGCGRTADFVRPQNKFRPGRVRARVAEGLPAITADPGQLQQVFINLFQNAAEAMIEKGTTEKRITVTTGWEHSGETVLLRVSDNGPGHEPRHPREGVRADVHDQAHGARLRSLHLLPDRRRAPRPHLGRERSRARRDVRAHPAGRRQAGW
jgi:hypothetical protein